MHRKKVMAFLSEPVRKKKNSIIKFSAKLLAILQEFQSSSELLSISITLEKKVAREINHIQFFGSLSPFPLLPCFSRFSAKICQRHVEKVLTSAK